MMHPQIKFEVVRTRKVNREIDQEVMSSEDTYEAAESAILKIIEKSDPFSTSNTSYHIRKSYTPVYEKPVTQKLEDKVVIKDKDGKVVGRQG